MNRTRLHSSRTFVLAAAIGLVTFARGAASPLEVSSQERTWEVQVGQETYASYVQRGEVIPRQSQLYEIIGPIARSIAAVADRTYYAPFRFILLNEPEPNAFSMPGGNVYITTGMLSYLRNRDELAGVICHEVNHDIHHDMYNVYEASRGGAQPIAYERAAETQADRSGAYTCAKAGFNPWGMVWNMRLHRGMIQPQQMASTADHPSDDQRMANLVALLTGDRGNFGRFRDDIAASTPLSNGRALAQAAYGAQENHGWYPAQYPSQYPAQYPSQYPAQYPSQYPAQYPSQYPVEAGPYPPPPPPACYPGC